MISGLRRKARDLFDVAVRAADPALALRHSLERAPFPKGRPIVIALGKAAVPMLREALVHVPHARAILITNAENKTDITGVQVFIAGHPVPDQIGEMAGKAVMAALDSATDQDCIIALISGGGSAMLPAPVFGVTLTEKMQVSKLLLAGGYSITEMNLVRQHLSRLKGGGFLRTKAAVHAYILSDVISDDLRVIASGPTTEPIGTRAQAMALLTPIWGDLPKSVQTHLMQPTLEIPSSPPAQNHLIGSNRLSLNAILQAAPQGAQIVNDALIGDVFDAAQLIAQATRNAPKGAQCLIFGGETTVTLRGTGRGGRNQELALRVAMELQGFDREWVFLSGGTDGRDGPTDAAGGIVDAGSLARMTTPLANLANNASYDALLSSDDLLMTGGTGTNVADVQIMLIAPKAP
jgi:glycerate 2-kinase